MEYLTYDLGMIFVSILVLTIAVALSDGNGVALAVRHAFVGIAAAVYIALSIAFLAAYGEHSLDRGLAGAQIIAGVLSVILAICFVMSVLDHVFPRFIRGDCADEL